MEEQLLLFCDNGIVGHVHTGGQGTIVSAYALFDAQANLILEGSVIEENVTNNYGELKAIREGILACQRNSITNFKVLSDSEFSVKAINGVYEATAETVWRIIRQIRELIKDKGIIIQWIPREANLYADCLTAIGLQPYRKTPKKIPSKEYCLVNQKDIILNRRDKP